jgi:hypothetical protein
MRFKTCIMTSAAALLISGCDGLGLFNVTGLPSGNYNGSISITQTGATRTTQNSTLRVTIDDEGFPIETAGPLQRLVADAAIVGLDEETIRQRSVRTIIRSGDTTTIHYRLDTTISNELSFSGFSVGESRTVISGSAIESYLNAAPNVVFSSQATITVTDRSTSPLIRNEPRTASRRETGILVRQPR